jgi:hypothetical protein
MRIDIQRFASGKYSVYVDGLRTPGIVLGGNKRWTAEMGGRHVGVFKTQREAAEALVNDVDTQKARTNNE